MSVLLLPFGKFSWIPACAGMTMDGPVPSAAPRAQARVQDGFSVIPAKARVQDAFRVTPAKAGVQGQ